MDNITMNFGSTPITCYGGMRGWQRVLPGQLGANLIHPEVAFVDEKRIVTNAVPGRTAALATGS